MVKFRFHISQWGNLFEFEFCLLKNLIQIRKNTFFIAAIRQQHSKKKDSYVKVSNKPLINIAQMCIRVDLVDNLNDIHNSRILFHLREKWTPRQNIFIIANIDSLTFSSSIQKDISFNIDLYLSRLNDTIQMSNNKEHTSCSIEYNKSINSYYN